MRSILTLFEMTSEEIRYVFAMSERLKSLLTKGVRPEVLPRRVAALLFEKPSLRTRVSFETGMAQLGGSSLFLGQDVGWGKRESIVDFAQVLGQYVDLIVCRANKHSKVVELAQHSGVPVINGLTDEAHPCQALADLLTLKEFHGELTGKRLAYVGDANNVAKSLAVCCAKLGMELAIASPSGYEFDAAFLKQLHQAEPKAKLVATHDPREAVKRAIGVYTDVWASMGQEAEQEIRAKAFADYQVNAALMKHAPADAKFLHCLPARRGEEVSDDVIDGDQSAVIPQAGNRMHVQKGLMAWIFGANV